jgi:signal transduction histidine kinase
MKGLDLDPAQQADFLDTIERQGRRLLRLIEELLTASQLERERADGRELRPVDVAALARTVARDMELTGDRIQVLGPERCVVLGEADLLQQVLVNLVDNAHKHGAAPVCITLEQTNGTAVVSVVDSGPGVAPEDRERIFERFIRLDDSGSRPGIGLGLPIVRDLLAACGGRVWVEDGPDGGAAFRISLTTGNRKEEMYS